jgi:polyphosphate kinase
VRRERTGIRRYVHLSTGNYNVSTTRLYTDFGVLTCDAEIGADASDVFNYLTGYSAQRTYRAFGVAPVNLRQHMLQLIEREIAQHRRHGHGRLIFKMNTLTDPEMIDALYRAAQVGVEIDLIVRGVCCLRPGVAGLSETIRVRSIIGRFLEHSRIYYFGNGGDADVYLGSADLMRRNLDRRVEVMFPVRSPAGRAHVRDEVLVHYLRDTENAHVLQSNGMYVRPDGDRPRFDAHAWFLAHAAARGRYDEATHDPVPPDGHALR